MALPMPILEVWNCNGMEKGDTLLPISKNSPSNEQTISGLQESLVQIKFHSYQIRTIKMVF